MDGVIILNNFTVCSDLPKIGPGGKILIAEIYRQFGVSFKKNLDSMWKSNRQRSWGQM